MKKYISTLLGILLCVSLVGCSLGFDASAYVKACLDATTKGEVTEYAKITNTSEEDALATYNDIIESELKALENYQITDEQKEKFRTLFQDMYKNFSYEVGEATKNSDGSYTVPVTTKKLVAFDTLAADSQSYITDYAKSHSSATTDELYKAIYDYMYDEISANIKEAKYDGSETINVQVTRTDDNKYTISEDSIEGLLSSMVDAENLQ